MTVTVTSKLNLDYLYIKAEGNLCWNINDLSEWEHLINLYISEIAAYKCNKVIIDETQISYPTELIHVCKLFDYIADKFSTYIGNTIIANVLDQSYHDLAEFWEVYSNNRGLILKVFYSLDDAVNYITLYE